MKWRIWMVILASVVLAGSGAQCVVDLIPFMTEEAGLQKFQSAEELRTYLADQAKTRQSRNGQVFDGGGFFDPAVDMATGSETDGDDSASPDYSTTNVQESGVDESDYIKNDAGTIYVLENNVVHIVQATPADGMTELATIETPEYAESMYLYGDTLVVLSQQYAYYYYGVMEGDPGVADGAAVDAEPDKLDSDDAAQSTDMAIVGGEWNDGAQSTATFFDVTDPANPVRIASLEAEGNIASSRMIDGKLHVVLTTMPTLSMPMDDNAIDNMTLDEWLPDMRITDGVGQATTTKAVDWQHSYRPISEDGYGLTMVVTIDVDNPTGDFTSTAVAANAGTIYASTDALYVTDTHYNWNAMFSRTDTIIHKLAFNETGTTYVGSGSVAGRTLNQYSMGEYDGYLRVATTSNDATSTGTITSNNVYVLGEAANATLDVVGSITGIAPGESIFAARFLGERGFLVTFERVDPLFTLDLSDPTNPAVVGQLKVPGFSDHIQMLGDNHLLTIGKDTQESGDWVWINGVQLSIFDVTDMSNPQLAYKEVIGGRGTHSEANYNPKAFNYFASQGLLALPITYYSDTGVDSWGNYDHTGLYVYRVDAETGFESLGHIVSDDDVDDNGCYWGYVGFTRGVFIGDDVYAVTDSGIRVADVADTSTLLNQIAFETDEPVNDGCYWIEDVVLPMDDASVR